MQRRGFIAASLAALTTPFIERLRPAEASVPQPIVGSGYVRLKGELVKGNDTIAIWVNPDGLQREFITVGDIGNWRVVRVECPE